jgi:hypothetical protein
MLPNVCSKFFAHNFHNIVFRWKPRADMDMSNPVTTGATIAGSWIPAQHGIALTHVWQHRKYIMGLRSPATPRRSLRVRSPSLNCRGTPYHVFNEIGELFMTPRKRAVVFPITSGSQSAIEKNI